MQTKLVKEKENENFKSLSKTSKMMSGGRNWVKEHGIKNKI